MSTLLDVRGSGPTDVWAVGTTLAGTASLVLHFDGHAWSTPRSQTGERISSVWAAAVKDAWIVGTASSGFLIRH